MASFDSAQFLIPSRVIEEDADEESRNAVFAAGDLNDDGLTDFVTLFLPPLPGGSLRERPLLALPGAVRARERILDFDCLGFTIEEERFPERPIGLENFDVNGDGRTDKIQSLNVQQTRTFGIDALSALVIFFRTDAGGFATLSEIDGYNGFIISDPAFVSDRFSEPYPRLSFRVVADASGDGIDDILVNAYTLDFASNRVVDSRSFLIFGGETLARADLADGRRDGRIATIGTTYLDSVGELYRALDAGPVIGGVGNDTVEGSDTALLAHLGGGDDSLKTGAGDDEIDLGEGNDWADLGSGDDTVQGGDGRDSIFGGDGNDRIRAGDGADLVDGGGGDDVVLADDRGAGADTVLGGDGDDTLRGAGGSDRLVGGSGSDVMTGGEGHDVVLGGDGDDLVVVDAGRDRVSGGAGSDVHLLRAAGGADRIIGFQLGIDVLALAERPGIEKPRDVSVTLRDDVAVVFWTGGGRAVILFDKTPSSVEQVREALRIVRDVSGTIRKDVLVLDDRNDIVNSADDADVVRSGGGDDTVFAGLGRDRVDGGDGRDRIYGGGDNDGLSGGAGDDRLYGNGGDDKLEGGSGNDRLLGGLGRDRLAGGPGADVLEGGADRDHLDGGEGADLFRFRPGFGEDNLGERPPLFELGIDKLRFEGFIEGAPPLIVNYQDNLLDGNTIASIEIEGEGSVRFQIDFGRRFEASDFDFAV